MNLKINDHVSGLILKIKFFSIEMHVVVKNINSNLNKNYNLFIIRDILF